MSKTHSAVNAPAPPSFHVKMQSSPSKANMRLQVQNQAVILLVLNSLFEFPQAGSCIYVDLLLGTTPTTAHTVTQTAEDSYYPSLNIFLHIMRTVNGPIFFLV